MSNLATESSGLVTGKTNDEENPKTSSLATFSTFFKSIVGTGMLALPPAVKACGVSLGTVVMIVMAALSWYTMRAVIKTIRHLRRTEMTGKKDGCIEYIEMVELAYQERGLWVASFSLIVCQVGGCVAYIVFICSNLSSVTGFSEWQIGIVLLVILVPLSLLRTTHHLSKTASLGNIALLVGVTTIYWYGFTSTTPSDSLTNASFLLGWDWSGLATMVGVALFMFSAHAEAVSIEQNMEKREEFFCVMNWGFLAMLALYLQFGLLVYAFFGDQVGLRFEDGSWVNGTIFDNIGAGAIVSIVKIGYSIALLVQFPISLLPASKSIESLLHISDDDEPAFEYDMEQVSSSSSSHHHDDASLLNQLVSFYPALSRTALVTSIIALSVVCPGFEFVTSLCGALGGILTFVLPPLCYQVICNPPEFVARAWAYVVAVLGFVGSFWVIIVVITTPSG